MTTHYGTHPSNYLERAKTALSKGEGEFYFYAALEIRTGIEARMKDYLKTATHISKAKKKGWEIAKLGKGIEEAFMSGDKIIQFQVLEKDSEKLKAEFYYTPVSKQAQKIAKKLGDYLHSNHRHQKMNEQWWKSFRDLLEEGVLELSRSVAGNLMGAPLFNRSNGRFEMTLESEDGPELEYIHKLAQQRDQVVLQVKYLDSMPPNLSLNSDPTCTS